MYCIKMGDTVWDGNEWAFTNAHKSNFRFCYLLTA